MARQPQPPSWLSLLLVGVLVLVALLVLCGVLKFLAKLVVWLVLLLVLGALAVVGYRWLAGGRSRR